MAGSYQRCAYCGRQIYRVRNGEWYHRRNASTSCYPGEGSWKRATPREIENAPKTTAVQPQAGTVPAGEGES